METVSDEAREDQWGVRMSNLAVIGLDESLPSASRFV